ncbi:unnamed protein product, partial [Cylicostephanus goldi]
MSASRFTEGISIQSKNIMEWVEKRLQSNEAGHDAQSPTTAPSSEQETSIAEPSAMEMPSTSAGTDLQSDSPSNVSADKKWEVKPEIQMDDDGWQIYDPTMFEESQTKHAICAVESRDIGSISSAVFEELPPNIKAELDHFHKLEQARRLKAAAEREKKPTGKKR